MGYSALKLGAELLSAGLPVTGVTAIGGIDWSVTPTAEQLELARQIMAAHDPRDYNVERLDASIRELQKADLLALKNAIAALPESATKNVIVALAKVLAHILIAQGYKKENSPL